MNKVAQHTIIDVGNYFIKYIGDNMGSFSAKYTTDYKVTQIVFKGLR
ncbi:hypothetical protein [Clostridium estertheticum]|nr:hypothetical protein [Clostridium estertheticum]MBZ9615263.1 hypothetical protein [Clostridium estertheticum subsp. laramiense]WAG75152.1 hypothetical protein LL032_06805 [Clostridium estertheticum]